MESVSEGNATRNLGNSKRRQQRQCIIEGIYMWGMQTDVPIEVLYNDYCEEKINELPEGILQADFVLETLRGVVNHINSVDEKIRAYAKNWAFDRIAKMDLAILRLAIYELVISKKTPIPVIINEAVELSKIYSSEDSKRFINGMLDRIAKDL